MPFEKGKPSANPRGRPKGAKDKIRQKAQAVMLAFADDNAPKAHEMLAQLEGDPREWLKVYLQALEYAIPKLARSEVSGPEGEPLTINIVTLARPASKE